jgi:hypothetical protein
VRAWPAPLLALLAAVASVPPLSAQVARPPSGGVLHPFVAPPGGVQMDFVGTWNATWDDPADATCPCRGTLTIEQRFDGALEGQWTLKGGIAYLQGTVAIDGNVWAGRFSQGDDIDFPLKGHFRLETRDQGKALSGSWQRDGTSIPFHWSATRR